MRLSDLLILIRVFAYLLADIFRPLSGWIGRAFDG